ncbi:hypothetical protein [Dickeya zeae]|uniref:hypothetical protein n=1 Tax=Dickeya zeae TaxID=204042 RepID=UPI000ACDE2B3|nr:hypothetical protein [Dickeya zeae]
MLSSVIRIALIRGWLHSKSLNSVAIAQWVLEFCERLTQDLHSATVEHHVGDGGEPVSVFVHRTG